jgi:hypothetical protein
MTFHAALEEFVKDKPQYKTILSRLMPYAQDGDLFAMFIFARYCARSYVECEETYARIAQKIVTGVINMGYWGEPRFAKAKITFQKPNHPTISSPGSAHGSYSPLPT